MTYLFLENLDKHISPISKNRLESYLALSGNDYETAICLYSELQNISKLYFHIIQEIEIAFRNKISTYLSDWIKSIDPNFKSPFFYHEKFHSSISEKNNSKLQKAFDDIYKRELPKHKKRQKKKQNIHNTSMADALLDASLDANSLLTKENLNINSIISELSFGFWIHLFNPEIKNLNSIFFMEDKKIFGNEFASAEDLYTQLSSVNNFRNRLFHHEPVWKNKNTKNPATALANLQKKYKNFSQILKKISPERYEFINKRYTSEHIDNTFCILKFSERINNSLYLLLNNNNIPNFSKDIKINKLDEKATTTIIQPTLVKNLSDVDKNILKNFHPERIAIYKENTKTQFLGINSNNFIILYDDKNSYILITTNHQGLRFFTLVKTK